MARLSDRHEVLVGLDPARSNLLSLTWGMTEAQRKGLGLHLILTVPPGHDSQHIDTEPQHAHHLARGRSVIENAVSYVRQRDRNLRVSTELVDGFPASEICRRSVSARFTVLGYRGLGRIAGALSAGSVVLPVCAHADSPVAVVRTREHISQDQSSIVVALADGAGSRPALAEAYEQASFAGASLEVFWLRPDAGKQGDTGSATKPDPASAVAGRAEDFPGVRIEREVMSATPVEELLRAGEEALAVVMCRKAEKGPASIRLGGVVRTLLHEARCPVIVTPTYEQ